MQAMQFKKVYLAIIVIQIYLFSCGRYAGYQGISEDEAKKANPEYYKTLRMRNAPSNLVITARLDDSDSILPNYQLEGEESAKLIVTVKNVESGVTREVGRGYNVACRISCQNKQIRFETERKLLGDIDPGKSATTNFTILVDPEAVDGIASISIHADEGRGDPVPPFQKIIRVNHLDKPKFAWLKPTTVRTEVGTDKIQYHVRITSESNITETRVLVNNVIVIRNGRPTSETRNSEVYTNKQTKKRANLFEFDLVGKIDLLPLEDSKITIYAENEITHSVSTRRTVFYNVPKFDLYLVAIGISDYKDDQLDLRFADDDARAICNLFRTQNNKLFRKVHINEIYNTNATRQNILSAMNWLSNNAQPNDLVILFIAAHGERDESKDLFIVPTDGNPSIPSTGVKWAELSRSLNSLQGPSLVFLDACRTGKLKRRGKLDVGRAIRHIANSEKEIFVFSAADEKGDSFETDDWGHGAFTKALLDGLGKGKADQLNTGIIYLHHLNSYVTDYVLNLTNDKQEPTLNLSKPLPLYQWRDD